MGKFYCYINSKLSCKSGIAPLLDNNGKFVFDNIEKANLLNNYFASVGTVDNNVVTECSKIYTGDKISKITFEWK